MKLRYVTAAIVLSVLCSTYNAAAAAEDAPDELVELLLGLLGDSDKEVRALAHEQVRTAAPGARATKQFADALPSLSQDAQIGLLRALADRGDPSAKPAVLQLIANAAAPLRDSAIQALGQLGDATDCQILTSHLDADDRKVAESARRSLIQLRGEGVTDAIVAGIRESKVPVRITLIEILTDRRALEAIPSLLDLAVSDHAKIRMAAMASLGRIASPDHVPGMAQGVLKAATAAERAAAEKNLMFVCGRIKDKDERATPLLAAMGSMTSLDRTALISALGRIGGQTALAVVEEAIQSSEPARHAAGIRAITNWPDSSAAESLISLAKNDEHEEHRHLARLALIRVAPLPDGRQDYQKLDLLKTAMVMAQTEEEINYALKRAAAIRLPETLQLVLPYLNQAPHVREVCQTIVELSHHRKLRDDNKAQFHAALDSVLATTDDVVLIDRANRYKNGQTWVRPK